MFGQFKKRYPVLKPEAIVPVDAPITTTNAKKIYRQWMVTIGYFDKFDASHEVAHFAEDMKEHEDYLRQELDDKRQEWKDSQEEYKSGVASLRSDIAEKQKELIELRKAAKDPAVDPNLAKAELIEVESELTALKSDLGELLSEGSGYTNELVEKAKAQFDAFRKDKRAFLVEYINREVHGD